MAIFDLKDGKVLKIDYDTERVSMGCPTCGYGSRYISWVIFSLTNYTVKTAQDSGEKFSDLDLIKLFGDASNNMTQNDFIKHIIDYMDDFGGFNVTIIKNDFDGVCNDQ